LGLEETGTKPAGLARARAKTPGVLVYSDYWLVYAMCVGQTVALSATEHFRPMGY